MILKHMCCVGWGVGLQELSRVTQETKFYSSPWLPVYQAGEQTSLNTAEINSQNTVIKKNITAPSDREYL